MKNSPTCQHATCLECSSRALCGFRPNGCCCCCSYHSDDPLDLGEALWLSHWQLGTAQSAAEAPGHPTGSPWANHVSGVSLASLEELWTEGYFQQPLRWRLGFREFGTSIGLQVSISNMIATVHNLLTDQACCCLLRKPPALLTV